VAEHQEKSYLFSYVRRSAAAVAVALLLAGMPAAGVLAQDAAPGSLDVTFSAGDEDGAEAGVAHVSLGEGMEEFVDVEIEVDGDIVVAGNSWEGDVATAFIARFHEDGTLDPEFGDGGIVMVEMDDEGGDEVTGMAVTEDHHIILVGQHDDNGSHSGWVARYHEDGTLDPEFGAAEDDGTPAGFVNISLGEGEEDLHAVHVDNDGHIMAVGSTTSTEDGVASWLVVSLHDDGTFDDEFDADSEDGTPAGMLVLHLGDGAEEAHDLAIEADNDVVIVGDTTHEGSIDTMVVRIHETGEIDETFGEAGIVDIDLGDGDEEAVGIEIDESDEHIFVLGNTTSTDDGSSHMFVMHLDENGAADATFGEAGLASYGIGKGDDHANHMDIEHDGDVVVVGETDLDGDEVHHAFVALLHEDGTLNDVFGDGGVAIFAFGEGETDAHAVHHEEDGHIVIAGNDAEDGVVWRVLAD